MGNVLRRGAGCQRHHSRPAGFTPSEVAGQSAGMQGNKKAETATKFSGFVHPEDRDAAHQAASRAFWSGFPQVMKYRQIQPDGSYVWTEYRAEPGYSVAIDTPAKISAQHLPGRPLNRLVKQLKPRK